MITNGTRINFIATILLQINMFKVFVFSMIDFLNKLIFYTVPLPPKVDGGCVFMSVCLSVCLSVYEQDISKSVCLSMSRISQKAVDGFGRNLVDRLSV